jgi:hypothetical protein
MWFLPLNRIEAGQLTSTLQSQRSALGHSIPRTVSSHSSLLTDNRQNRQRYTAVFRQSLLIPYGPPFRRCPSARRKLNPVGELCAHNILENNLFGRLAEISRVP